MKERMNELFFLTWFVGIRAEVVTSVQFVKAQWDNVSILNWFCTDMGGGDWFAAYRSLTPLKFSNNEWSMAASQRQTNVYFWIIKDPGIFDKHQEDVHLL